LCCGHRRDQWGRLNPRMDRTMLLTTTVSLPEVFRSQNFKSGLVLALVLFAAMATFFPPYLNNDDLFYGAWAAHQGRTGEIWSPVLSRQFTDRTELLIYTPLHMALAGEVFRFIGFSEKSADLYTAASALLTSLGCMIAIARVGLGSWSLAVAPLGFVVMAFAGLRPEVTSDPLFAIGLALLLGSGRLEQFVGRTLLVLAPLAAPSALGPAAAALAVFALHQVWEERRIAPIVDSALALVIGIGVLGYLIGFRYSDLVTGMAYHATRDTLGDDGQHRDLVPLASAFLYMAGAAFLWLRVPAARMAALLLLALGVGRVIGWQTHMRAGTSMVLTYLAAASFFGAALPAGLWRKTGQLLLCFIGLVLVGHLFSFWVTSSPVPAADREARAAVEALRRDGRTVIVDEIAAKYLYDYAIEDKISWTWLLPFPLARPTSLADLTQKDIWVVSRFTLLGYLRGKSPFVAYLDLNKAPHALTIQMPCALGRISCRLPARRFDYVLFWRDASGQAYVRDMLADKVGRPIN
jgi:hypothetical protein